MLDDQQVDPHPQALKRNGYKEQRAVQHGIGGGLSKPEERVCVRVC